MRHHWWFGPGWSRLPSLAAGLAAIAEEGSTAHLQSRTSSPASQPWSKGWAPDEVIVECDVELRLGAGGV